MKIRVNVEEKLQKGGELDGDDETTWKFCLQLPKNIENNQVLTDRRCKKKRFQPALQTAEINSVEWDQWICIKPHPRRSMSP